MIQDKARAELRAMCSLGKATATELIAYCDELESRGTGQHLERLLDRLLSGEPIKWKGRWMSIVKSDAVESTIPSPSVHRQAITDTAQTDRQGATVLEPSKNARSPSPVPTKGRGAKKLQATSKGRAKRR